MKYRIWASLKYQERISQHLMSLRRMKIDHCKANFFYQSPYFLCEECNTVIFINVTNFKQLSTFNEHGQNKAFHPEPIPSCPDCKRTLSFQVGVKDLCCFRVENAEKLKKKKRRQRQEVVRIQRAYRSHLVTKFIYVFLRHECEIWGRKLYV